MTSLSDDSQSNIMESFNSTSIYLDDLINIDNPYFEGMVNQIYPPELQLNKTNTLYTEGLILELHLFLSAFFPPKFLINAMTLIYKIFPLWMAMFHVVHLTEYIYEGCSRNTRKSYVASFLHHGFY